MILKLSQYPFNQMKRCHLRRSVPAARLEEQVLTSLSESQTNRKFCSCVFSPAAAALPALLEKLTTFKKTALQSVLPFFHVLEEVSGELQMRF